MGTDVDQTSTPYVGLRQTSVPAQSVVGAVAGLGGCNSSSDGTPVGHSDDLSRWGCVLAGPRWTVLSVTKVASHVEYLASHHSDEKTEDLKSQGFQLFQA